MDGTAHPIAPIAGFDPAALTPAASLLRHRDGRTGTFVEIEPDGRLRVQSLRGKGFWVFPREHCEHIGQRAPQPAPVKRREVAKALTRSKVLTAALGLFETRGYARTTIRDIAAAVGMSTGAVFANFEDKDALWSAVFGGPAPDLAAADEIARTLGALPDHRWMVARADDGFRATITSPGFDPVNRVGQVFGGKGPSLAAALRQAREAATHGVRPETVQ